MPGRLIGCSQTELDDAASHGCAAAAVSAASTEQAEKPGDNGFEICKQHHRGQIIHGGYSFLDDTADCKQHRWLPHMHVAYIS